RLGRAGMALGNLYETRARLALRASDVEGFTRYAELCLREYESAENPLLGARVGRLLDEARQRELVADEPLAPLRELLAVSQVESEYDTVHSRMLECVDSSDRARCALTLLLQATERAAGYLFGVRHDRAALLAALPDGPIDPGMPHWVEDCVYSTFGSAGPLSTDITEETRSESILCFTDADGRTLEPVFLFAPEAAGRRVAAVLVLQVPEGRRTLPSRRILDDLASELLAHGDVG
ncbi:MAG TPA: hypothetical protein VJR89_40635, partial [Polyangiales bacterium]|nr:hypothetical protein [Polyangiales bacterium]